MKYLTLLLTICFVASLSGCKASEESTGEETSASQSNKSPSDIGGCNSSGNSDIMNPHCQAPTPAPTPSPTRVSSQMSVPRSIHTATVLKDGRVLVVGGTSAPNLASPAEIYDPATNTWSSVGVPIAPSRLAGSTVLLPDGRVVIAGGEISCQAGKFYLAGEMRECIQGRPIGVREVEIFNPEDSEFHLIGRSSHARGGATLNLLGDGTVLLLGGSEFDFENARMNVFRDGDLYNPMTGSYQNSWMNMILPRFTHTATVDKYGGLVITGGYDSYGRPISRNEYYVCGVAQGTYEINPFSGGRALHHAFPLPGGDIVYFGGVARFSGANEWNVGIDAFAGSSYFPQVGHLPDAFPMAVYATAQLPDSRVLVAGGTPANDWQPKQSIFVLDPITYGFEPFAEMSQGRTNFTMSVLKDGSILVVGGTNNNDYLIYGDASAERIY